MGASVRPPRSVGRIYAATFVMFNSYPFSIYPFERQPPAQGAIERHRSRNGVGLTLARQIAMANGGSVNLGEAPMGGTRVRPRL